MHFAFLVDPSFLAKGQSVHLTTSRNKLPDMLFGEGIVEDDESEPGVFALGFARYAHEEPDTVVGSTVQQTNHNAYCVAEKEC